MAWAIKDEYYGNQYITKETGSGELKVTPDLKKAVKFFTREDAIAWIEHRWGYISVWFKFVQV